MRLKMRKRKRMIMKILTVMKKNLRCKKKKQKKMEIKLNSRKVQYCLLFTI